MTKKKVLIAHWLPEGTLDRWRSDFSSHEFVEARSPDAQASVIESIDLAYGLPDLTLLPKAKNLRWLQLASAGVPAALCPIARERNLRVTNLAGLYGPTIAEHAIAMLLHLNRNLHVVAANQMKKQWDRSVATTLRDLRGKTLAIVGTGNIGQNIGRLAKAFGMNILGCRRRPQPTPYVDQIFAPSETRTMFSQADYAAIAGPLVPSTTGMVGEAELRALRPGAILVNVSRGPIVQEEALLANLRSGHLAGAGLDVFAVEPLPADHPFWSMPNVVVSPHYSGETVNLYDAPSKRFQRNLHAFEQDKPMEGIVDCEQGY